MLSAKKMIGFLVSSTRLPILLVMFVLALSVGGALYFFSTKLGFSAPVIHNVDIHTITPDSATIIWDSDVPGDSVVEYGTTRALLPATAGGNQVVTTGLRIHFNNSVPLYRLSENTIYFFKVSSTNWAGTTTDDNGGSLYSFTTAAVADLTFSNIQVLDITATSASVTWETNVPSHASVERNIQPIYFLCPYVTYNPQADPIYCAVWDMTLTTNPVIRLAELQPETKYHFRVRGALGMYSPIWSQISPFSFTTLPSLGEAIDLQIDSSDDDAHEVPGASPTYSHTDPTILAGSTAAPITDGWRWDGLAVPAGSTITEAWVELHQNRRGRGFVSLLSLEDSPNPAPFSAASTPLDRWNTRTQWEIRWAWPHTKVVPTRITTASLVNGVQELVDKYGGINSIVLLERGMELEVESNLTNQWSAYDLDPSLSARLHIQFIGPSDTTVPIISAD